MEEKETSALETITDGITNLPAPVETSLFKALGQLLGGLTAIPASWLKRPAQAIDDVTVARSTVTAIIAKGIAEDALKDPAVMQAAAEIYLPTTIRKARNRVQIAKLAAKHTAEDATTASANHSAPPEEDWMNVFMRFAEDASSEKLQDLFARILAGEVTKRGSFSLATLRAVSELDKSIAEDFSLVWAKGAGQAVDHSHEFNPGEWFSRWKRLSEAGLMAPSGTIQYPPPFQPILNGNAIWGPMSGGKVHLLVQFSHGFNESWPHIDFTRVGREIGSVLAKPDYEGNIRSAAQRFVGKTGVKRIELHTSGGSVELIA